MIDNNKLKLILNSLNLEKVAVVESLTVYCFPKKNDEKFQEKFKKASDDLKKMSNTINLKIVEEGEISNDYIEFCPASPVNESSGHGK